MTHDQQMIHSTTAVAIQTPACLVPPIPQTNTQIPNSQEEKFTCSACSRDFLKRSKLNRHIREHHMNIKEQVCVECGKNFKRNSHLKRHMISHSSNPKPYKCSYNDCHMAFTCKHHLDRHVRIIHFEDYKNTCDYCPAKFPKKITLSKHLTFDHGKAKPLSCEACQKSFFTSTLLSAHTCSPRKKNTDRAILVPVTQNNQPIILKVDNSEPQCNNTRKRKSPFQPVYHENKNFSLSGDQQKYELEAETIYKLQPLQEMAGLVTIPKEEFNPIECGGSEPIPFRNRTRQDSQQGSCSIKMAGRKLSELFQLHDLHERKNSVYSDYGNFTIFKDLFAQDQQSDHSRRTSIHANSRRKSSFFHLQKLESEDQESEENQQYQNAASQINGQIDEIALPQSVITVDGQQIYQQIEKEQTVKEQGTVYQESIKEDEIARKNEEGENEQQNEEDEAFLHIKKTDDKCYKCYLEGCNKFYTKLSNLKTHIRTYHFKSKDFKCNYSGCNSAYLHKKSLKEHIARVHQNIVIDPIIPITSMTIPAKIVPVPISQSSFQIQKPQVQISNKFQEQSYEQQPIIHAINYNNHYTYPPHDTGMDYLRLHENDLALTLFSASSTAADQQAKRINYHQEFRYIQLKQQQLLEQQQQQIPSQSPYFVQHSPSTSHPINNSWGGASTSTESLDQTTPHHAQNSHNSQQVYSTYPNSLQIQQPFEKVSSTSSMSSQTSMMQPSAYMNYPQIHNNHTFNPNSAQQQVYIS